MAPVRRTSTSRQSRTVPSSRSSSPSSSSSRLSGTSTSSRSLPPGLAFSTLPPSYVSSCGSEITHLSETLTNEEGQAPVSRNIPTWELEELRVVTETFRGENPSRRRRHSFRLELTVESGSGIMPRNRVGGNALSGGGAGGNGSTLEIDPASLPVCPPSSSDQSY